MSDVPGKERPIRLDVILLVLAAAALIVALYGVVRGVVAAADDRWDEGAFWLVFSLLNERAADFFLKRGRDD